MRRDVVLLGLLVLCAGLSLTGSALMEDTEAWDVDVIQHDLKLVPDFERRSIAGEQRITFRIVRDGTDTIRFSDNALQIVRSSLASRPVSASREAGEIVFRLPEPLPRERVATLTVTYEGVPKRGLTFGSRSVYTGYFACDWMFCQQDRTGDKARFNLTLSLPRGMSSIGIGNRRSIVPAGDLEDHVWREDRPYSSYLFGFAAGAFQRASERARGTDLVYLSENESAARLQVLFNSTPAMVEFFEDKAGVRLPPRQYTQLLVSGNIAQEVAHFSVLGADVVKPILGDPKEDWAIAHELAHQWWGNLVTCESWTEMWLNEGITTFMVAAWKEHRWGRAAYDRELTLFRQRVDVAVKAGLDVPLTFAGQYPSLTLKRAIVYSKGALFMDQLRRDLGDDRFWGALRTFTRTYAGDTVTSRDFQRTFEAATGRRLSNVFEEWVY